jgi:hypothetical protein
MAPASFLLGRGGYDIVGLKDIYLLGEERTHFFFSQVKTPLYNDN